jgi:CDP-diacylglycerol--glycerol-3-phosphate 3-phosphatidyltransferase
LQKFKHKNKRGSIKNGTATSKRQAEKFQAPLDKILKPATLFLARIGIHPNALSLLGATLTLGVPWAMVKGQWMGAGLWLLFAGFFDILDGSLARNEGLKSRFGAFLDSTLDRVSEAVVLAGFLIYYQQQESLVGCLLAFCVFLLSMLVSYTRARAEGLGLECRVGLLPRPGRVALLALGFFFQQPTGALILVGLLSLATVFQRIYWVWSKTRRKISQ